MSDRITSAWDYHRATSYVRNRIKGHALDFNHYPAPAKSYVFLKTIDIQHQRVPPKRDVRAVFSHQGKPDRFPLDIETLASVMFLAYGVKGAVRGRGITFYSRMVPSAGGLYPCHLYLLIHQVDGIETGLYYCDLIHQKLGMIQKVVQHQSSLKKPGASFIITSEFYNSTWKYGQRAFRYMLLDAGHLIENVSLSLKLFGFKSHVFFDLDDDAIMQMLSLNGEAEVPLAVICLNNAFTVPELSGSCAREYHQAGRMPALDILKTAYDAGKKRQPPQLAGKSIQHKSGDADGIIAESIGTAESVRVMSLSDALIARKSRRNFVRETIKSDIAGSLFQMAVSFYQSLTSKGDEPQSDLMLGVVCQYVEKVEDGFYLLSKERGFLSLQSLGRYHHHLAQVCLDQMWMADAGIHFMFMAHIKALEKRWGPRGYRYLLMESGRIGQRIYLGATSLGLGCCAVGALYDSEAQILLNLADETVLFYVVSAGVVFPDFENSI